MAHDSTLGMKLGRSEAENERMHLMTFVEIARPTVFQRLVVMLVHWIFYVGFFLLYAPYPQHADRSTWART